MNKLLAQLGYERDDGGPWAHPAGRKAIIPGDLVDRGPRIVDTLKTVIAMSQTGTALMRSGLQPSTSAARELGPDLVVCARRRGASANTFTKIDGGAQKT